tara:strand:- start:55 stop:507 length:453 start_codon:yes stop_codon:yes gene_type:complete
MNITNMVHININCSDYQRSKQFYEMLGFEVFWKVPETNTPEVAQAVGMSDYRVNGALMRLRGSDPAMVIDLLEWQAPRDNAAPYPNLHRPGLARIALRSSDLMADYEFLLEQGVEVLSPPATVMLDEVHGSRFFCFKDPDGTYLELVDSF